MSGKVELLVPVGRARVTPISPAPRLKELKGKVIGFLQNGKPNSNILLSRLAERMQKFDPERTPSRAKPRTTEPAEFVEEMAKEWQGAVNAVGD